MDILIGEVQDQIIRNLAKLNQLLSVFFSVEFVLAIAVFFLFNVIK
jgi:hypothetical protein